MNSVIYFHNLKFDGAFILDYLFRQGYFHSVAMNPVAGTFTTLISNMAAFYSVTVKWWNGHVTEFRDSLKKIPLKVKDIAKAFKLDESKGDIDYHLERPKGWQLTRDERSYIARDVLIVAKAVLLEIKAGMTKLTVGADSLAEYKRIVGPTTFRNLFPIVSDFYDADIRKAYRGGFTLAPERFRGQMLGHGRTYDVNSLYPSVMYDRILPYGEPVPVEGFPEVSDEFPLMVVSVTFTAVLKPDHVPCIQVKGSSIFNGAEYQTEIVEPVTLFCTNIDLALWEEHYDMRVLSYNGGYLFKGMAGMFTEFIDKWMAVKMESEGGMKTIAKLHLNSLYGKFATNPDVTGKVPVFFENVVKLVTGDEETREPVYTAMGVFITAYARNVTIRAAQQHYDVFAYADTDSLHLLIDDDPEDLWVDPKALGAWKFEYAFDKALFVRAKAYTERAGVEHGCDSEDDAHIHEASCEHVTHIAGLPDVVANKLVFDDFWNGNKFEGKLAPKRVPGGIILEDVEFTMTI